MTNLPESEILEAVACGGHQIRDPVLEGRRQYRIDPAHRTGGNGAKRRHHGKEVIVIGRIGEHFAVRSPAIYQAIGSQLARGERP